MDAHTEQRLEQLQVTLNSVAHQITKDSEEIAALYQMVGTRDDELRERDREIEVLTTERDNALLRVEELERRLEPADWTELAADYLDALRQGDDTNA
jgi:predicted RNase H-like nuclease (RuvC/YqgF family)